MAVSSENDTPRLMLDAKGLAKLLGICRQQVWKMHSAGKLPRPVYLTSKAPRWSLVEIQAWIETGCPDRQAWERIRKGGKS